MEKKIRIFLETGCGMSAGGKRGVPQGGVALPLLANIYLNDLDIMLEEIKEMSRQSRYLHMEYARFADDIVILIDGFRRWNWLETAVYKRVFKEIGKLDVRLNQEKTKVVTLADGEAFSFLGFDFRRCKTHKGKWGVLVKPRMKARKRLLRTLKDVFRRYESQPVEQVIQIIKSILRGWVNYFRIGQSRRCFGYVRDWVEKKIRRHMMRARKRHGFGWKRWSRNWLYETLDYMMITR